MELKWYFPKDVDEAVELIQNDGVVPHAGGTGLLLGRIRNVKGLVDLSNLGLDFYRDSDNEVVLGAMLTFSEVVKNIGKQSEHILVKSLRNAATELLRNRITVGGSVAYFPIWSDLIGPLIALRAQVELKGPNGGTYPIENFLKNRTAYRKNLIVSIKFPKGKWKSFYHRATRTKVDYPAFAVTILRSEDSKHIEMRIVLTGNKKKFVRFNELERKIGEEPPKSEDEVENLLRDIKIEFTNKRLGSAEYLEHLAKVVLCRGIVSVLNIG